MFGGWVGSLALAAMFIAVVIASTAIVMQWMNQRHEYRMQRLEQDHEIVEAAESLEEASDHSTEYVVRDGARIYVISADAPDEVTEEYDEVLGTRQVFR